MPLPRDSEDWRVTLLQCQIDEADRFAVRILSERDEAIVERDEAEFQRLEARAWAIRYKKLYEKSRKQYYMWVAFSNQNKKRAEKAERERDELERANERGTRWSQDEYDRLDKEIEKLKAEIDEARSEFKRIEKAYLIALKETEEACAAYRKMYEQWAKSEREKLLLLEALKRFTDERGSIPHDIECMCAWCNAKAALAKLE